MTKLGMPRKRSRKKKKDESAKRLRKDDDQSGDSEEESDSPEKEWFPATVSRFATDAMSRFHSDDRAIIALNTMSELCQHKGETLSMSLISEITSNIVQTGASTVRSWVLRAKENNGVFPVSRRGKHKKRSCALDDENVATALRSFVHQKALRLGQSNMRIPMLKQFTDTLLPLLGHKPVSERTLCRYLHKLGFSMQRTGKGIFIDGHDRADVIQQRLEFLEIMENEIEPRCNLYVRVNDEWHHVDTISDAAERSALPLGGHWKIDQGRIIVYSQDESTFGHDEQEIWFWADHTLVDSSRASKFSKKKRSSYYKLMISAFVCEQSGILRIPDDVWNALPLDKRPKKQSSTEMLLVGKNYDGYFTGEKFVEQLKNAIDIHNVMYPGCQAVFLLDWSGCHRKAPDNALSAYKMNRSAGGKQPDQGTTMWNGRPQVLGKRGLVQVLEERGVSTANKSLDELRQILSSHPDFAPRPPMAEEVVTAAGHRVVWLPKFHCELNPIEMVWNYSKKMYRKMCVGNLPGLRRSVPIALEAVSLATIRRYFRMTREYAKAYRQMRDSHPDGKVPLRDLTAKRAAYTSHRRVFKTTLAEMLGTSGAEELVEEVDGADGGEEEWEDADDSAQPGTQTMSPEELKEAVERALAAIKELDSDESDGEPDVVDESDDDYSDDGDDEED